MSNITLKPLTLDDIKDGVMVYRSSPFSGISAFKVVGDIFLNGKSQFISGHHFDILTNEFKSFGNTGKPYITEQSLKDLGIIPQTYNGSKCFATMMEAQEHMRQNPLGSFEDESSNKEGVWFDVDDDDELEL